MTHLYRGRRCRIFTDPWSDGRYCVIQFETGHIAVAATAELTEVV